MAERLQWIKLEPRAWLDANPLRGGVQTHQRVHQHWPLAERCLWPDAWGDAQLPSDSMSSALGALQVRQVMQALSAPWWSVQRWRRPQPRWCAPAAQSVDMVWSNMALHMDAQPTQTLRLWLQALRPQGFVMFSCLGPDTLRELRQRYAALGWQAPAHEYTDMHDWGDMLVQAGFAEPVMDMERVTLTYACATDCLAELRQLGRNLHAARYGAVRTRAWLSQLQTALMHSSDNGGAALTFEIIYGHALRPQPRPASQPGISLEALRAQLPSRDKL